MVMELMEAQGGVQDRVCIILATIPCRNKNRVKPMVFNTLAHVCY